MSFKYFLLIPVVDK